MQFLHYVCTLSVGLEDATILTSLVKDYDAMASWWVLKSLDFFFLFFHLALVIVIVVVVVVVVVVNSFFFVVVEI